MGTPNAEENIRVSDYVDKVLHDTLIEFSKAGPFCVDHNQHFSHCTRYFKQLQDADKRPVTMVSECSYQDRNFLADYAALYTACAFGRRAKYDRDCLRIHFFQTEERFDITRLREGLVTKADSFRNELSAGYLGFIVVKPLPVTFIGMSTLKPLHRRGEKGHYLAVREYKVHFLGLELTVDSLAFQEQDTVAAACATSALWCVFHATGILYHHYIPSPIEITRYATERLPTLERNIPSHGLDSVQMATAIRKTGLEADIVGVRSQAILKATAYAYLREGNPLVLNADLYDASEENPETGPSPEKLGAHAVALTGFKKDKGECIPHPDGEVGTLLTSSRITRLYCHDDQVGAFAPLEFNAQPEKFNDLPDRGAPFSLGCSWCGAGKEGKVGDVRFAPYLLLIPVHNLVRIGLDAILEQVFFWDGEIEECRKKHVGLLEERLEWDVFLTTSSGFKADLRGSTAPTAEINTFLEKPLPRFVWRAIALDKDGEKVFEFLFDATDIEQGDYFLGTIHYRPGMEPLLDGE